MFESELNRKKILALLLRFEFPKFEYFDVILTSIEVKVLGRMLLKKKKIMT